VRALTGIPIFKRGGRNSHPSKKKETTTALIFIIPAALIIVVFNILPTVYSVILTFFNWNGFSPEKNFIGLDNFRKLIDSREMWNSTIVTLIYAAIVTLGSTILGLLIAITLDYETKIKAIYRVLYFLPVVTPTVASGIVWKYLFDPYGGVVNNLLSLFSIQGPAWLSNPKWALLSVSIVGIWKRIGFCMVIYLAALQGIPRSYYEAAKVDGASEGVLLYSIKIPLLMPISLFLTITGVIEAFQVFDLVYVMTYGGPVDATDVMGFLLYRYGFKYFNLGYASTIACAMFTIIFILSFIQWKVVKGGEVY